MVAFRDIEIKLQRIQQKVWDTILALVIILYTGSCKNTKIFIITNCIHTLVCVVAGSANRIITVRISVSIFI